MLRVRISSWHARLGHASVPDMHAWGTHQFLTSTLTARISFLRCAQHALKGPFQIWNFYAYAEHTCKKLMRMLRYASVPGPYAPSSWCICSAFFKGTALCARLVPYAYTQGTQQFLTHMLSPRISSWRVCSAYASVPDTHAQSAQQFLTRMLRVYKMNIWKKGKLMRMLSMRIRNWCIWSVFAPVSGAHAQGTHQFLTRRYAQYVHKEVKIFNKKTAKKN
jgi:hypothetical protein